MKGHLCASKPPKHQSMERMSSIMCLALTLDNSTAPCFTLQLAELLPIFASGTRQILKPCFVLGLLLFLVVLQSSAAGSLVVEVRGAAEPCFVILLSCGSFLILLLLCLRRGQNTRPRFRLMRISCTQGAWPGQCDGCSGCRLWLRA